MQRAAKSTRDTDLLLTWLAASAKCLPKKSLYLFNVRSAIADIYHPIPGDFEKGKLLQQEVLTMTPKTEPWYEYTMNETKTRHRMQLADILFCQFQAYADPTKKEEIIEELKHLPSAHTDADDNIRESHVDMLRANMLRIMGPAREYQAYMNELFSKCIRGLEDSISWDDKSSLRLLPKVLASLERLERDATIAISAQFSILDLAIHDQDTGSQPTDALCDTENSEADVERQSAEGDEALQESDKT
ncbi:unnamed protein product [Alternaria sp. RS040]